MKMKLNRITMGIVSALFVFALISCDLQMPTSLRIKSSPGLYLSLGSPFAGQSGMSLNEYLSVDGLTKQLGGGTDEDKALNVLEWTDPDNPDIQAYRVRYPVADINIDLSSYVADMDVVSSLPGAGGGWIPGTGTEIPIPIPLSAMSFVSQVTGVKIKLTLKFAKTDFAGTSPGESPDLMSEVPTGVSVTFRGNVFDNPSPASQEGSSWSSPEIQTFHPLTDTISIGVTVPAGTIPTGIWFQPALEFDWTEATLKLGENGVQEDKYELDFSNFKSFMGDGISFKEVSGYMYVKTPDDIKAEAEVKLTWTKEEEAKVDQAVDPIEEPIENWQYDKDGKDKFSRPPDDNKIPLTDLFTYPLEFSYKLTLQEVTIEKNENKSGRLAVDMVILLPLEFKVESETVTYTEKDEDGKEHKTEYKKLDLNIDTLKTGLGDKDLFGREPGAESSEDNIFDSLEYVKILLDDYTNEILAGPLLGIKNGTDMQTINLSAEEGEDRFIKFTNVDNPFSPQFEIIIPAGETLKIFKAPKGRDAVLDFTIAVEAKTNLNYPIKF